MTGQGIILMAFGGHMYIRECRANIRSIRRLTELPITIFTNTPEKFDRGDITHCKLGEQVINGPRTIQVVDAPGHFGFKNQTLYVNHTPYEYTLALDCDAIPIHTTAFEPFALLHRFDFCAAHAAARGAQAARDRALPC